MFEFFENNKNYIEGFIGCFDRIRCKGHLDGYAYAAAMQHFLYKQGIRIFDYPQYAKQLTDKYKSHVKELAIKNNIEIQHVNSYKTSKEKIVQEILKKRGDEKGLVHIISAVESGTVYQPRFNKKTKKSELISRMGKCLHYYFYFIDPILGLCYFRVPTWPPFGIQFYCNGHHYLYKQLDKKGVSYTAIDNALIKIDNFKMAQRVADKLKPELIMQRLRTHQNRFCPMIKWLDSNVYWIIDQAEYATDFVFKDAASLQPVYDNIIKKSLATIKPENVYSFFGKKLTGNYQGELGNDFKTRTCGTRIKHYARDASLKMYDKFGKVLRIETTVNNLNFFRTQRTVDKRDGTQEKTTAPMKKSIFSLIQLRSILLDCNKRYIDFIASIDEPTTGQTNLEKVTNKIVQNGRRYRGLNFFEKEDQKLLSVISDPKYYITGLSNKSIREKYKSKTTGQISRLLKNLRVHGIIKKIPNQYKYFVTKLGKAIINAGLEITEIMMPNRLAV